jgi:hypothetical protein
MSEFPATLTEMETMLKRVEEQARAGVKLMAWHIDPSLLLPKHQQGLLTGMQRFAPHGQRRQQAETWAKENRIEYWRTRSRDWRFFTRSSLT